jgi:CelD/BcsL family acetyltransferase involved in cellulose biosynthesis
VQETPEMDHFFWGTKPSIGSPVVELPDTVDAYLNDLSRKSRYNVRKKKRKLEENFGFEIRPFFDVWQLNEFWQHMEEIERNSWKFKVGKDLVSHPEVKDFYSRLLQAMASKGLFRGFILFVEKKPVAYEMAFEFQNQLFSQKIAYDASWAHTSAGFVLKTEVIRWAIEKGLTHNHLLGDEEPWKVQLNGRLQPHVHLKIYAPGFRSKVVAKAEFEGIKKLGKIKHSLIEMKRILL